MYQKSIILVNCRLTDNIINFVYPILLNLQLAWRIQIYFLEKYLTELFTKFKLCEKVNSIMNKYLSGKHRIIKIIYIWKIIYGETADYFIFISSFHRNSHINMNLCQLELWLMNRISTVKLYCTCRLSKLQNNPYHIWRVLDIVIEVNRNTLWTQANREN